MPFRVGETLTYDVSWSTFLTAGTVTMTVKEKKPSYGSTAYYIVAEAAPAALLSRLYALYYKADTLLDVFTLASQRGSVFSQEGRRTRMKTTIFDQQSGSGTYELRTASVVKKELKLRPETQDALAAIYRLRTMPLRSGMTVDVPVSENGSLYRLRLVVAGREAVRSGVGTLQAWKITPTILEGPEGGTDREFTLWISDDARRLPLRIQAGLAIGSVEVTLRDVR